MAQRLQPSQKSSAPSNSNEASCPLVVAGESYLKKNGSLRYCVVIGSIICSLLLLFPPAVSASVAALDAKRASTLLLFKTGSVASSSSSLAAAAAGVVCKNRRYPTPLPAAGGLFYSRQQRRPSTAASIVSRRSSVAFHSRRRFFTDGGGPLTAARLVSTAKSSQVPPDDKDYSYDDLTIFGRVIAGVVEIATTVAMEYCTGFLSGYLLGSVTGLPALLTKRAASDVGSTMQSLSMWKELAGRTARMHGKSVPWAKSWGSISAAFGGFRVGVRVVRNGKEDEWNTVFSSMAAGAYFARAGASLLYYELLLRVLRARRTFVPMFRFRPPHISSLLDI